MRICRLLSRIQSRYPRFVAGFFRGLPWNFTVQSIEYVQSLHLSVTLKLGDLHGLASRHFGVQFGD